MALRQVIDHPKFEDLRAMLGAPRCDVLGVLECQWHFTARYASAGDIGKWGDSQILAWLGWKPERGELIEALVKCHWLDRSDEHRLIVHDWHEHADIQVHTELAKKTLLFANGAWPKLDKTYFNNETRKRIKAEYEAKYPGGGQNGDKSPIGIHIVGGNGGLKEGTPGDTGDKSTPLLIPHSTIPHSKCDDVFQDLPEQFNTSVFKEMWIEWEHYHRTIHYRAIQPMQRGQAWQDILNDFGASVTPDTVIVALTKSIASGWKKPYPPKSGDYQPGQLERPPEPSRVKEFDQYEADQAEAKRQRAERMKKGKANAANS